MARYNITKKNSTKKERLFYEVLKEMKVEFKHRWIVCGREIDFIINNHAIEIDGHEQDGAKNSMLVEEGYIPVHLNNNEINKLTIKQLIKNICQ